MKNESRTRARAKLDLGDVNDFKPSRTSKRAGQVDKTPAQEAAKAEGFTSRQSAKSIGAKIDGRSLRATGRNVQLNIAVKPETKDEFWKMAKENGFEKGEEFLLAMMKEFNS